MLLTVKHKCTGNTISNSTAEVFLGTSLQLKDSNNL